MKKLRTVVKVIGLFLLMFVGGLIFYTVVVAKTAYLYVKTSEETGE